MCLHTAPPDRCSTQHITTSFLKRYLEALLLMVESSTGRDVITFTHQPCIHHFKWLHLYLMQNVKKRTQWTVKDQKLSFTRIQHSLNAKSGIRWPGLSPRGSAGRSPKKGQGHVLLQAHHPQVVPFEPWRTEPWPPRLAIGK